MKSKHFSIGYIEHGNQKFDNLQDMKKIIMGADTNCISGKPHMGLGKFQNFRKRTFLELKTHTLGNFRI